jgi:hypothetical protein
MRADLLASAPDGLDEAVAAVDAFDQALVAGLVRPRPVQAAGLAHLAEAVAGTPLASRVAEAAEKAAAGVAGEDHFVALAAARTALLGAAHDALMAQVQEATGRSASAAEAALATGNEAAKNLLTAARSWLSDLARVGWQGLDSDVVAGSAQVLSAMLPNPSLRRLAVLFDGFAAELAVSCPGATIERFPARRWADMWSRALMLTLPGGLAAAATEKATGRLLPLGLDLQEHATAVQVQVHAVFEPAGGTGSQSMGPRLVRASVSAPKPDTVIGAGLWQMLRPHMSLLSAISEGRAMELTDMPLTVDGDLIWSNSRARRGEPADPFATARVVLPTAADAPTAPLGRHPASIAVPVFLEGYAVAKDGDALTFTVAGRPIAVDTDRIPVAGPLTPEAIAKSGACIGLLRWDDGAFLVQPLAVETTVKKKVVAVHAGAWVGGTTDKNGIKAENAATEAIVALVERAGKLLRK